MGNRLRHFFQHFLVKLIIGTIVFMFLSGISYAFYMAAVGDADWDQNTLPARTSAIVIFGALAVVSVFSIVTYRLFWRYYERRNIRELSQFRFVTDLPIGLGLGLLTVSLTIGVVWLFGEVQISGPYPAEHMLSMLFIGIIPGITEEIVSRGIIQRILDERFGSFVALTISALIFGLMHIANTHSSLYFSIILALQAGVFLGLAYIATGSLWLPIGLHIMWNFTQTGIFGTDVSGEPIDKGLFDTELTGSDWLTGGLYGIEGSVQATIFALICSVVFYRMAVKNGNWRSYAQAKAEHQKTE